MLVCKVVNREIIRVVAFINKYIQEMNFWWDCDQRGTRSWEILTLQCCRDFDREATERPVFRRRHLWLRLIILVRCCSGAEAGGETEEVEKWEEQKQEWGEESFHTSSEEAGTAAWQWYYSDITNTVSMNVKNKGLESKYAPPNASCGIKGLIQYMKGRNLGAQRDFRFHLHLSLSICHHTLSLTLSLIVSHWLFLMHPHSLCRLGDKSLCQITLG